MEDGLRPLPTAAEQVFFRRPEPSLPGRLSEVQVEALWGWARLQNDLAQGVYAELEEVDLGPLPSPRQHSPHPFSTVEG